MICITFPYLIWSRSIFSMMSWMAWTRKHKPSSRQTHCSAWRVEPAKFILFLLMQWETVVEKDIEQIDIVFFLGDEGIRENRILDKE